MRKGLRIAVLMLPWLLVALLAWGYAVTLSEARWAGLSTAGAAENRENASRFIQKLGPACASQATVIAAAEARGWTWQAEPSGPRPDCVRPAGLGDWISVEVQPFLMMSTYDENAIFIGFDAHGCMAPWAYARGPGSTCPDP